MKRIGVAGLIRSSGYHSLHLLLGRRGKDPNRGMYVLPGGGVEDGETLEEAFRREIKEETDLTVIEDSSRWQYCPDLIELSDRIILIAPASIDYGMSSMSIMTSLPMVVTSTTWDGTRYMICHGMCPRLSGQSLKDITLPLGTSQNE
jgi:hypothetical protein